MMVLWSVGKRVTLDIADNGSVNARWTLSARLVRDDLWNENGG